MNECEQKLTLDNEIGFMSDMKSMLQRVVEMKDATVPMHCFIQRLGVYISNCVAADIANKECDAVDLLCKWAVVDLDNFEAVTELKNKTLKYVKMYSK